MDAVGAPADLEVDLDPAVLVGRGVVAPDGEGAAPAQAVQAPFDGGEDRALAGAVVADHGDQPVDVEIEVEPLERAKVLRLQPQQLHAASS
jgi:hypothetical protein